MTMGVVGALLTAWVTFVPSFLWIFLGAPYVERLRGHRILAGGLTAVTAAVVGVILDLALWLGLPVLFKGQRKWGIGPLSVEWPVWTSVDLAALALLAVAVVALFVFRLGVVVTLLLCAGLGVAAPLLAI
jgi:chromate transporter